MTEPVYCQVLGPVLAQRGETPLDLGPPQQRLVVAALALSRGRALTIDQLTDAVWGANPPRAALATLRTYVSRLRTVLGNDVLVTRDGGYALADVEVDLARSDRLVSLAADEPDLSRRRDLFGQALDLWTAEPLSGLSGQYADAKRTSLAERRLTILEQRLSVDLELGGHAEAITELTPLSHEHPYRERSRSLLMLALYRAGRQAEALASYDDLRRILAGSSRTEPGGPISELYRKILRADPSLGAPTTVVPAVRAAPGIEVPKPAQLPLDTFDFTGRQAHVERLDQILRPGTGSLVMAAISGIGGVGKTALATHVAHRVRQRFDDGQLYADMRGADGDPTDPAAVLTFFLRAFGTADNAIPDNVDERIALFRSTVADRRVLIVLDNVADVAQIRPLLPGSDTCAVLMTSRIALTGLPVAGHVDLRAMDKAEAASLFSKITGASRADAEPESTAAILAACDYLPLAVRIAGSRLAARPNWTIADFADRLSDENRRLSELRTRDLAVESVFALSYQQLDAEHARVFRLLAVPEAPGWRLATIAAVLGVNEDEAEELMEGLVDLQLVDSHVALRYRYHDLLRLYARELTTEAERQWVLHRLLDYYLACVRNVVLRLTPEEAWRLHQVASSSVDGETFADAETALEWRQSRATTVLNVVKQSLQQSPDDIPRCAAVIAALNDLVFTDPAHRQQYARVALQTAEQAKAHDDLISESQARIKLSFVYYVDCRIAEAETEARTAMALSEKSRRVEDRIAALDALHPVLAIQKRDDEALKIIEEMVDHYRRYGPPSAFGTALVEKARTLLTLGRTGEALTECDAGIELLRECSEPTYAYGLYALGQIQQELGEFDSAIAALEEVLRIRRDERDTISEGTTLFRIAAAHLAAGDTDNAVARAEESIAVCAEAGEPWGRAQALWTLADALSVLGQSDRSRACLEEALEIFTRLDIPEAAEVRELLTGAGGDT